MLVDLPLSPARALKVALLIGTQQWPFSSHPQASVTPLSPACGDVFPLLTGDDWCPFSSHCRWLVAFSLSPAHGGVLPSLRLACLSFRLYQRMPVTLLSPMLTGVIPLSLVHAGDFSAVTRTCR